MVTYVLKTYSGVPNSVGGLNSMGVRNCQNLIVWGSTFSKKISMGGVTSSNKKKPTYNSAINIIFKSHHPKIKCNLQLQSPSFYVNSNIF